MSLSGTSSCYGNQSILTAKGKTTALTLLKWPFHFSWPSKLKFTVPFHWSTTYATYRHGPNEENGNADGENSIFLVCSYFLFLLYDIFFLSSSFEFLPQSQIPAPSRLFSLGLEDVLKAAVLPTQGVTWKAIAVRGEIRASQKEFGNKNYK